MFFITSDQNKIHYLDEGPREANVTMVFVPGWGYCAEVFAKQIEYFSKCYRVLVMEPRGHGQSQRGDVDVSHEQQTKDLLELLAKEKIEKAVFVGWSYGAYPVLGVVRKTGLKYVQKMVIIDQPPKCTGNKEDGWVEYHPENIERALSGLGTEEGYRTGVENFTRRAAFLGEPDEEEIRRVCNMADMDHHQAVKEFLSGAQCDFTEEAKQLDQDGRLEFFVREQWAEQARAHLTTICPNAKTHILGGHMMFYEFPERFNRILEESIRPILK